MDLRRSPGHAQTTTAMVNKLLCPALAAIIVATSATTLTAFVILF